MASNTNHRRTSSTGRRRTNRRQSNRINPQILIGALILVILLCAVIFVVRSCGNKSSDVSSSGAAEMTQVRDNTDTTTQTAASSKEYTKLAEVDPYDSVCVIDEIGWFSATTATGTDLKYFYNKTGVQPYIYLKAYDASLNTNDKKLAWAQDYFDNEIAKDNAFLYVYFAEEETDTYVGYMCYIEGVRAATVMDEAAVSVMWQAFDDNWYTNQSTDAMFLQVFKTTADTLFPGNTHAGVIRVILIVVVILLVLIAVFLIYYRNMQAKRRRKRRR